MRELSLIHRIILAALAAGYTVFVVMDIMSFGSAPNLVKYICVALCFCLILMSAKKSYSRSDFSHALFALLLTLIADGILLFTNHYFAGVIMFCLVQLTYIRRYKKRAFLPALAVSSVIGCVLYATKSVESIYAVSIPYALLFLTMLACASLSGLPHMNKKLAIYGALLFLACDISVAAYNLLPYPQNGLPGALIWVFYLPSQVMISLSVYAWTRE